MAKIDKVKPLKYENPIDGTQLNIKPTETNPTEDYVTGKGFSFENNDDRFIDLDASGYVRIKDANFTTPITIKELYDLLLAHASRHLPNGADPLATGVAVTLNADSTNTEGNANSFARSNHTHDIDTGTAVTIGANSSNQEGNSPSLARSNHTHDIDTGVVAQQLPDQTNAEGTSNSLARADHTHNIPTDAAVTIGANSTNTQGNANTFSRSNHTHDINTGNVSTQNAGQTNTEGTSDNLARADHLHQIPTATPVDTGTTNNEGTSTSFARADHVHKTITGKKAGLVDGANFAGTPRKLTVTFDTAYPNTNYTIHITGEIAASWSYESKSTTGFVINSNRNQAFTGEVSWHCITTGET